MFEFKITGVVQGVGFRPFVYNLAISLGVVGYVQNTGDGVKVLCDDKGFSDSIMKNLPALAKVNSLVVVDSDEEFLGSGFEIRESENVSSYSAIPADLNLCEDCLSELFDENDFRHKYFFISCTNCGPRFSIVKGMPYDRAKTSLDVFEMCDVCRGEYEDPKNRRYHAQTVACKSCGPRLDLYVDGKFFDGDAIEKVVDLLVSGEVVAIKGVGGFHLVCRAKDDVVLKLKDICNRHHKPFALMGKDLGMIEKFCFANDKEREILQSRERPIVLLNKKNKDDFLEVSELSSLGFMLPYSAIHYLIFKKIDFPLVMTSSNLPHHPITTKKEEQFVKYVLDYNRDIVNSVDDSIVKVVDGYPLVIRRSRGLAPNEIFISENYKKDGDVLAMGAEMKNAFCIKKGDKLIASQHIGNTFNLDNFENFKLSVARFSDFVKVEPLVVLCDYNAEFNTSKFAKDYASTLVSNPQSLIPIQHHVAHGFSVATEHNLKDFIAVVCDGTGLGVDGKVWGGEVFHNDKRIGRLEYQSLVGGDVANREPARILTGILSKFLSEDEVAKFLGEDSRVWVRQKKENFNCIDSSSCGRVLDVVSVLLGFSDVNFYEGRGAMILESNSKECELFFEPKISKDEDGLFVLDTSFLIKFLYENLGKIDKCELAYFAQIYLVKGLYEIARMYDDKLPVCFCGGCVYNYFMSEFMMKKGVCFNKEIPSGDGGIAMGQIGYWLWKN